MKKIIFLFLTLSIMSCSKPSTNNSSTSKPSGIFKYEVTSTGSHWNGVYSTSDGGSSQISNAYSLWTDSETIKTTPFVISFNAVIDSPQLGGTYIVDFFYNNTKVKVDSFAINGQTNIADMTYIIQ
jgi:hypothetical protein